MSRSSESATDLDRLKELLFGHEKKALDAITRRLDTAEARTADVADVLPDAIQRSHSQDPRLQKALLAPVEAVFSDTIRRNPENFADALFPVIGPAIRKAIAESLKTLVQSINNTLNTKLSPSMRLRAWRAGTPLAEYVLRESLVYRVEDVYLIKPESGLLIDHVQHVEAIDRDEDAVSAMFTAIQDFVKDAFAAGEAGGLEGAQIGEHTMWAVDGPYAMLVCVIRGVPPQDMRSEIKGVLERIHLRYGEALQGFDGQAGSFTGIEVELEECLGLEERRDGLDEASRPKMSLGLAIGLLAIAALAAFGFYRSYSLNKKLVNFRAALGAAPGIVVTELERDGSYFSVVGLRDPLADKITDIAVENEIPAEKLSASFTAFQSLAAPIAAARAAQILDPPAGVTLQMEGTTLAIAGAADPAWRARVEQLAVALPGIDDIDLSGLRYSDAALLATALEALAPPAGLDLTVKDARLTMSGSAPARWLQTATERARALPGLSGVDSSQAQASERVELARLSGLIHGQRAYFEEGVVLRSGDEGVIAALAGQLRRYGDLAKSLGSEPRFAIHGFSDGAGGPQVNVRLRLARAGVFRDSLAARGLPAEWFVVHASQAAAPGSEIDPQWRKAELSVVEPAAN